MAGMEALIGALVGLLVGAIGVWLLQRTKSSALEIQHRDLSENHTNAVSELATANARLERLSELETLIETKEQAVNGYRDELESIRAANIKLEAEVATERRSFDERKAELERALKSAEETMKASFDSLASKALSASSETFIQLAQATFEKEQEKAKGELTQRKQSIDELVKPLSDALRGYEEHIKKLESSHQERDVQTNERIEQLIKGIQQQQSTTQELRSLLRGPSSRGRAGEMLLERIFEAAGLTKNLHYFTQQHESTESGTSRPDFIVKMPGEKEIVIDSKFILSAYEAAMECEDERARSDKLKEHATHVKGHIDSLAKRPYVERSKNTELVIMFLPLDACLTAAQEVDAEIATKGWDRRIIVATPSLLFAVMRIVALDWRQESLRENADEIRDLGRQMVDRIRIAVEHFSGIGDGLEKATKAYNSAVTSIQSQLLTSAYRFQKLEAGKEVRFEQKKLPKLVDREPSYFTKTELLSLPLMEDVQALNADAPGPEVIDELVELDSETLVESPTSSA
ncbi:MAG TPA: DNA recombination protein RmuC [Fimbriimonadaceae bacterium]|nr:DNA recombination protein RmuC [Fimbriimonadaceae bacterium]